MGNHDSYSDCSLLGISAPAFPPRGRVSPGQKLLRCSTLPIAVLVPIVSSPLLFRLIRLFRIPLVSVSTEVAAVKLQQT